METRQLGRSPVKVTPVIFGAWAIGGWMWGGSDEKDAVSAIQASLDHGVTTIDTAAIYGMGYSEELVAKAIKGRRDQVVIATKCGMRWDSNEGAEPWLQEDLQGNRVLIRKNAKPDSIVYECEQSLKRLGVDVIDLYQIHWPDPSTPIEESWNAMVKLKAQGKVRAIGVSNYSLHQLQQAHAIHPVDSLQPPYSLIRREIEEDMVPFCLEQKIGIIAYSPMERGLLTGKVTMDRKFPKGDHRENLPFFKPENRKKILAALEKIRPIAERHGATLSQVIIHSTFQMPGITAAIVGARNPEQAIENAGAVTLQLTQEDRSFVVQVLEETQIDLNLK
ncbi:MAG: aldo/keto reductase [Parachlamydia sp.]|nr:aldo/keto reductase [Parachlamydia sp.]